jgi:hypothetical protein
MPWDRLMNSRGYVSNELIHWTGRDKSAEDAFAILRSICEEQILRLSYCPNYVDPAYAPKTAMVCFTDIPLRYSGEHCDQFGQYGIAFHKQAMIGYGANPVLYTTGHHFEKVKNLGILLDQMKDLEADREWRAAVERYPFTTDETLALIEVMEYLQEYAYKNHDDRDYVTYYQREWRLTFRSLPFAGGDSPHIPGTGCFDGKGGIDRPIFKFAPQDVAFLVVPLKLWWTARPIARMLGCGVKIYEWEVK